MSEQKNNHDKIQEVQAKKMIMWTGIIFFMLLIVFIWTVNAKKIFQSTTAPTQASDSPGLKEIKKDLSGVLDQFRGGLDEFSEKEISTSTEEKKKGIKDEELESLKQKLEDSVNQK